MKQIELTREQVSYLATYIEEELDRDSRPGCIIDLAISFALEKGIEAYNGGAR